MASGGKKKTTMAKLNREAKVREKRQDKAARKDARKHAAANGPVVGEETLADPHGEPAESEHGEPAGSDHGQPAREPAVAAQRDA